MEYMNLYKSFKQENSEGQLFFETKEKENLIDETDGMHVAFGMVVVPYILEIIKNGKESEITKAFAFLEKMALSEEVKICEVLDFTVIEKIADQGHEILNQCKNYMGLNTLKHCEEVEKYFM
ncbi:DUF7674 family protein [Butyrivibrio sp. INlla21]|uniref:DUF7674 family protein n=1 Tax=Butyrivibrio sp. INlla21 TaxID=1520811 RepID=UPI0008F0162C|nr:hypothetical protein [Butyrivibrio sp. INlla21]SFU30750.1 hypothetical protein SAMN02910342_00006 [Butyrivibrio sp. INlla21]